jgi:hypothetical protein
MKKLSKISEDSMTGIGTIGQTNTSTTTATPTGSANKKTINVKKKDLTDPTVQNYISKTKDVNVTVLDEEGTLGQVKKLQYLSNVRDAKDGVSQPFTIGEKRYQMVRVLTPTNEKTIGVYSLDETDEAGENIIYDAKEFETNIAKKAIAEEGVVEPEAPEMATLNPDKVEDENPSFAGYRHFIVNNKTKKARKFKTIEELAQAQMGEGEQYMGVKSFKKYVDEALFGQTKKRSVTEVDAPTTVATDSTGENDVELQAKAQKLMDIIKRRVPDSIIKTIVTPIAKREVIAAFAELVGVSRNGLAQLVAGIKALAKTPPVTSASQPAPVSETKIIKVKDIKK